MIEKTLSGFQCKALNDLGLALVDWHTDRAALPGQAQAVAAIVGCTTEDLFCLLQGVLCSIMTMKRELDIFDQPMIDIAAAREQMRESNRYGGRVVQFSDRTAEPGAN